MTSLDTQGYLIGNGSLDNIEMSTNGLFTQLSITTVNKTNGAPDNYTVSFISTIPVSNYDNLYIQFPRTITLPTQPVCVPVTCLSNITC